MKILGIETSCDETAAAIVTDQRQILSNIVHTQLEEHAPYGGVVPEIASRAHLATIKPVIKAALEGADLELKDIDLISVTAGPGLIGGVIVGLMTAKALSLASNIPFIGVNHLTGHALTARLVSDIQYPYALFLASGGHCQILDVRSADEFILYGQTRDDAMGEAFDKVAKMLGLGYPGGPKVEALAKTGDANRFAFPLPLSKEKTADFSFSGLKTAVLRAYEKLENITDQDKADLCASFQRTCGDVMVQRLSYAMKQINPTQLVMAGGVAANQYLQSRLTEVSNRIFTIPINLCTDNAAMIAWAGYEQYLKHGESSLDMIPRARWPLYSQ